MPAQRQQQHPNCQMMAEKLCSITYPTVLAHNLGMNKTYACKPNSVQMLTHLGA